MVLHIRVGERQVQRGVYLNNLVLHEEYGRDGMDLAAMAEVKLLSFLADYKVERELGQRPFRRFKS